MGSTFRRRAAFARWLKRALQLPQRPHVVAQEVAARTVRKLDLDALAVHGAHATLAEAPQLHGIARSQGGLARGLQRQGAPGRRRRGAAVAVVAMPALLPRRRQGEVIE